MGIVRRIVGPRSKYIKDLPYTYEATVTTNEELDVKFTLVSDTVCGLVEHLKGDGVEARDVEIREIREASETLIEQSLYAEEDGTWRMRPNICRAFEQQYPGHVRTNDCTFQDRSKKVLGG
ncbi:MAG: hypothetical protein QF570_07645 [Myxococcota bacterium]|jgi:hypothetical protein|nr:hypothetical protein [Myxococcota bacterium]